MHLLSVPSSPARIRFNGPMVQSAHTKAPLHRPSEDSIRFSGGNSPTSPGYSLVQKQLNFLTSPNGISHFGLYTGLKLLRELERQAISLNRENTGISRKMLIPSYIHSSLPLDCEASLGKALDEMVALNLLSRSTRLEKVGIDYRRTSYSSYGRVETEETIYYNLTANTRKFLTLLGQDSNPTPAVLLSHLKNSQDAKASQVDFNAIPDLETRAAAMLGILPSPNDLSGKTTPKSRRTPLPPEMSPDTSSVITQEMTEAEVLSGLVSPVDPDASPWRVEEVSLFLSTRPGEIDSITVLKRLNQILAEAGYFSKTRRRKRVSSATFFQRLKNDPSSAKTEASLNDLVLKLIKHKYLIPVDDSGKAIPYFNSQRLRAPDVFYQCADKAVAMLKDVDPLRTLNITPQDMKGVLLTEQKSLANEKAGKMIAIETLVTQVKSEEDLLKTLEQERNTAATQLEKFQARLQKLPEAPLKSPENAMAILKWEEGHWQLNQDVTKQTLELSLAEKAITMKRAALSLIKSNLDNAIALQRVWNHSAHQKATRLNEALIKIEEAILTQKTTEQMKSLSPSADNLSLDNGTSVNHDLAEMFRQIEEDYYKSQALMEMNAKDSVSETSLTDTALTDLDTENKATLAILRAKSKTT